MHALYNHKAKRLGARVTGRENLSERKKHNVLAKHRTADTEAFAEQIRTFRSEHLAWNAQLEGALHEFVRAILCKLIIMIC